MHMFQRFFSPIVEGGQVGKQNFQIAKRSSENPWACWTGSMKCWRCKLLTSRPAIQKQNKTWMFECCPSFGARCCCIFFCEFCFEVFMNLNFRQAIESNVSCNWWWCTNSCQKMWCESNEKSVAKKSHGRLKPVTFSLYRGWFQMEHSVKIIIFTCARKEQRMYICSVWPRRCKYSCESFFFGQERKYFDPKL